MRKICGRYLGFFVFNHYLRIESILNDVEKICKELRVPLLLPERKILKVLKTFLGWKRAVLLMHKMDLIKSPN
jgi:hypothetical protein